MKLIRQLLSVTLALLGSAALASAIPGRAEVKKITGTATVSKGTGAATTLAEGMVLGTGDTLSTGAGSVVDLWLGLNGDVLRVEPDSILKLDQLDVTHINPPVVNTRLNVTKGGITANVITKLASASRYEVRTPSGVAGIRGTIYNASVGTGVGVIHGNVTWSADGRPVVSIFSGQSATADGVVKALAQALLAQSVASASASTATVSPAQLANTVNTLAQSVATAAAMQALSRLPATATDAEKAKVSASAAADAAEQATTQIRAALETIWSLNPFARELTDSQEAIKSVYGILATTTLAAGAVGAAVAITATGGTIANAAAAAQIVTGDPQYSAMQNGAEIKKAVLAVAATAAANANVAFDSGQSPGEAASGAVAVAATATTQTVTNSSGTGTGATVTTTPVVIENPLEVSASGGN